MSYSKAILKEQLGASDVPTDSYLARAMEAFERILDEYGEDVPITACGARLLPPRLPMT